MSRIPVDFCSPFWQLFAALLRITANEIGAPTPIEIIEAANMLLDTAAGQLPAAESDHGIQAVDHLNDLDVTK